MRGVLEGINHNRALEALSFGKFQWEESPMDAIDAGSCTMVVPCCFEPVTAWSVLYLYHVCPGHLFLFPVDEKPTGVDPQQF